MQFCDTLKLLRSQHDLKQDDIASILSVNSSTVSRLENGLVDPTATHLLKLSEHFGVSVDYLLNGTKEVQSISDCLSAIPEDERLSILNLFISQDKDIIKLLVLVRSLSNEQIRSIIRVIESFQ